jgi:hypothetical protein
MTTVNEDEVNVIIAAMKPFIAKMTYMGISIASHVTDAEYRELAVAVSQAIDDYRDAPSI